MKKIQSTLIDKSTEKQSILKPLSLRVEENIFERVDIHVRSLKHLNKQKINKKEWIAKAISEKLANETEIGINIPRAKQLNLKIDLALSEDLDKRVQFIKKFRESFTKKQWIVEAILEKLEREEAKTKESFKEMHKISLKLH